MQKHLFNIAAILLILNMSMLSTGLQYNETSTHVTEKENWIKEVSSTAMKAVHASTCVIGFMGNVAVLVTIVKTKELHNPSLYLVANLAVTDIWTTVNILANDAILADINLPKTTLGAFLCHFWETEYSMGVALMVTAFTLVAIAFDRYAAVTKPIFYRTKFNGSFIWKLVLMFWIVSALYTQYVMWIVRFNYETGKCSLIDLSEYNWVGHEILWPFLIFYFPVVITFGLYLSAFLKLRNKMNSSLTHAQKYQFRTMKKLLKFCVIVTLFYSATIGVATTMYLTAYIPGVWPTFYNDGGISAALVIGGMNSWANPIIYSLSNKTFRRGLFKTFTCGKWPAVAPGLSTDKYSTNSNIKVIIGSQTNTVPVP